MNEINKYNYENDLKFKLFKENENKKEILKEIENKLKLLKSNKTILNYKKIELSKYKKYYNKDYNYIKMYLYLDKNNIVLIFENDNLRKNNYYYTLIKDMIKYLNEYLNYKDLLKLDNELNNYIKYLIEKL